MSLQKQPRNLQKIMNDILKCIPPEENSAINYLSVRFQQIIDAYALMPSEAYPMAWHEAAIGLNQTLGDADTDWKRKIVDIFSGKLVLEKPKGKTSDAPNLTSERRIGDDPFDSVSDVTTKPDHKWAKSSQSMTVRLKGELKKKGHPDDLLTPEQRKRLKKSKKTDKPKSKPKKPKPVNSEIVKVG